MVAPHTRCSPSSSRFGSVTAQKPAAQRAVVAACAQTPSAARGRFPADDCGDDEDMTSSVRRQLAEKVDLRELAHLEQLAVFSDPQRVPGARTIASTFLGLVPSPATPELPPDTRWHPVSDLPPMAFDHGTMVEHARTRLVAKMSYTNIGFALAPKEFALSTCGTSTAPRSATRSTRPICNAYSSVATSSPEPAPRAVRPQRRPARGAVPVHRVSPTGSPTNSPRCARPGESTGFLTLS